MKDTGLDVVTGAFGFSGRYITRELLARGRRVRTITGHPGRESPFGDMVEARPFDFDAPDRLAEHLAGADTLYNTYWIRFPHRGRTFEGAVADTAALLAAAEAAGVRRFVHVSITNPSEGSPLPYFRLKAEAERLVRTSGLSHAILRPTVIFGAEDILINNIAWMVRRFPAFPVPWGEASLQPVFVEDLARLAVEAGAGAEDVVWDAVGPERYGFSDLVAVIAEALGRRVLRVPVPPMLMWLGSMAMGALVRDVVLTRDEVAGLMAGLLVSAEEPRCFTLLSRWLADNAATVGAEYHSEVLRRH